MSFVKDNKNIGYYARRVSDVTFVRYAQYQNIPVIINMRKLSPLYIFRYFLENETIIALIYKRTKGGYNIISQFVKLG
jgi:hypothetical protein